MSVKEKRIHVVRTPFAPTLKGRLYVDANKDTLAMERTVMVIINNFYYLKHF